MALLALLSACGGDSTTTTVAPPPSTTLTTAPLSSGSTTTSSPEDSGFPITIEHVFGETVIESRPERVATIHWGNHDVPIALGVVPVGMQFNTYGDENGDGVLPWTYEALETLGATGDDLPVLFDEVDGIDFAGIDAVTPDVILAAYSGITEEEYQGLSQAYPVVAYPVAAWGTNWRDMALINGEAIGLAAEAETLVTEVEATMADAMAARPSLEGLTFAYGWIDTADTSSIWIYSPVDARVQYLETLGLVSAPGVVELIGDSLEFGVPISAENVDILADADVIVTYGDEGALEVFQADPLLSQIPAIASGAVALLPLDAPISAATSGPTVLSIPWAIDAYLDLIEAAASNVGE
jgi:iron complex transport system substrate-binding protein